MKRIVNKVTHKANMLAIKAKMALTNNRAEGFVDTAIKILMAVVIGALVLAGLYSIVVLGKEENVQWRKVKSLNQSSVN